MVTYSGTWHACCCCLALLLGGRTVGAQTEVHTSVMPRVRIVPGEVASVRSNAIDTYNPINSDASYTAVVNLVYNRQERSDVVGSSWGYRVGYEVHDTTGTRVGTGALTLLHFASGRVVIDQDRFSLPDDQGGFDVTITSVQSSVDEGQSWQSGLIQVIRHVPTDIHLALILEGVRYDALDPADTVLNLRASVQNDHLVVHWSDAPQAEYYEVELAWRSSALVSGAPSPSNAALLGATRVETRRNQFSTPFTYSAGRAAVRVRMVGRHLTGADPPYPMQLQHSAWSEWQDVGSQTGFESDKHWQVTSSYAEAGKQKNVVRYFDDGLKARQTVTDLSTDDIILRTTTHYDREGRPIAQVLPAPDLQDTTLHGVTDFNNLTVNALEAGDAELASGAGKYYSDASPALTATVGTHNAYIPDAAGYPYTQTRYLNDGTGRVHAQSGVGPTYKLGSGHETTYVYDDPSAAQLRRLFGSNVGEARYYQRQVVVDAHGQMAVSYLDNAGRTIATALAGPPPTHVISADTGHWQLSEDLMANNVWNEQLGTSQVSTILVAETDSMQLTLSYAMLGLNVQAHDICRSCRYQLIVHVEGLCEDGSWAGNALADTVLIQGMDLCNVDTFGYEHPFAPSLQLGPAGPYAIRKSLEVLPYSPPEWLAYLPADSLPDTTYFLEQFLAGMDTTACVQTCEQWCARIVLATSPNVTGQALADAIAKCVRDSCALPALAQGARTDCDAALAEMIRQMSPGGCQYDEWSDSADLSGLEFVYHGELVAGPEMHAILRSGVAWQDDWGDTLATIHPEYCHYQFCVEIAEYRVWDFTQTVDTGYWQDLLGDADTLLKSDPFFMTGALGAGHKAAMQTFLDGYGAGSNACPEDPPLGLVDFVDCLLADSPDGQKARFYFAIYLHEKLKFVDTQKPTTCPGQTSDPACQVVVTYAYPIPDDVDEALDSLMAQSDALCTDICAGQAAALADILIPSCGDSADWNALYNLALAHCQTICGPANPFGVLLAEDADEQTYTALQGWLATHGCDSLEPYTLQFDRVYSRLGEPGDAGVDVVDTICLMDTTRLHLYPWQDSVYQAGYAQRTLDSLLAGRDFLMDTGLYYFVGYDSLCGQFDTAVNVQYSAGAFTWFDTAGVWYPGDSMGIWPHVSDFRHPGCYTFGFYAPAPAGCNGYSEITLYVPGCASDFEIITDSLSFCEVSAVLDTTEAGLCIDTVIWTVSMDGSSPVTYVGGDTLDTGREYIFEASIVLTEACCDTVIVVDTMACACPLDSSEFILSQVGGLCLVTPDTICSQPTSVQWQSSLDGGLTWSDLAGETNTSYQGNDGELVRLTLECSDANGCFMISNAVQLECDTDTCAVSILQTQNNCVYTMRTESGILGATGGGGSADLLFDLVNVNNSTKQETHMRCLFESSCGGALQDTTLVVPWYVDIPYSMSAWDTGYWVDNIDVRTTDSGGVVTNLDLNPATTPYADCTGATSSCCQSLSAGEVAALTFSGHPDSTRQALRKLLGNALCREFGAEGGANYRLSVYVGNQVVQITFRGKHLPVGLWVGINPGASNRAAISNGTTTTQFAGDARIIQSTHVSSSYIVPCGGGHLGTGLITPLHSAGFSSGAAQFDDLAWTTQTVGVGSLFNFSDFADSISVVEHELTASASGCAGNTPTYVWQNASGQSLGSGSTYQGCSGDGKIRVVMTCGSCTAQDSITLGALSLQSQPPGEAIAPYESRLEAPRIETELQQMLNIYPNPTTDACTVQFEHAYAIDDQFDLMIHNSSGELVHSSAHASAGPIDHIPLSTTAYPGGFYLVTVRDHLGAYSHKLLVIK